MKCDFFMLPKYVGKLSEKTFDFIKDEYYLFFFIITSVITTIRDDIFIPPTSPNDKSILIYIYLFIDNE